MNLSEHFTLEEFVRSQAGERLGIDNDPPADVIERLRFVATQMEKVRALLGQSVHIDSGYRSPELNAAVGGAKNSQHMLGEACDFVCPEFGTPLEICRLLTNNADLLQFDQLIWEGSWVHCSFVDHTPRMEVLTWRRGQGYTSGLYEQEAA